MNILVRETTSTIPRLKKVRDPFIALRGHGTLAQFYHFKYQDTEHFEALEQCFEVCQTAFSFMNNWTPQIAGDSAKAMIYSQDWLYSIGLETAWRLYEKSHKQKFVEFAWELMSLGKGAILENSIRREAFLKGKGLGPGIIQQEKQLRSDYAFCQGNLLKTPISDSVEFSYWQRESLEKWNLMEAFLDKHNLEAIMVSPILLRRSQTPGK
ncbi:MAG: hypothetical protein R3B47_10760 [Bacteroidia bacterium]